MTGAMEFDIAPDNFNVICRVCLRESPTFVSIHEVVFTHTHNAKKSEQEMPLKDVLKKYCKILVHKEDLKPQNICEICMNSVARAFDIFELFQDSNLRLDNTLRQVAAKLPNDRTKKESEGSDVVLEIPFNIMVDKGDSANLSMEQIRPLINNIFTELKNNPDSNIQPPEDPYVIDIKIDNSSEDKKNIVQMISDSESGGENVHDGVEHEDNSKPELQDVEGNMERLFMDITDLKKESQDPSSTPTDVVSLPNTGKEKWDHTYYTNEGKLVHITDKRSRRIPRPSRSKGRVVRAKKLKPISEVRMNRMVKKYYRENEVFNCRLCEGVVIQGMDNVIEHLRAAHSSTEDCIICTRTFTNPKLLMYHVASHARKAKLICMKCSIYFKDKESLEAHYKSKEHMTFKSKCSLCPREFNRTGKLTQHIEEVHHNRGAYKTVCTVCGLVLKYRANLKKHLRTHKEMKERKTFLCEHCARSYTTSTALKQHVLIEHEGLTHLKKEKSRDRDKLKEYRRRLIEKKMKKMNENYVPDSSKTEFRCEYCAKISFSRGAFFKHRLSHPECTKIECPFCDAILETPDDYKCHRLAEHSGHICDVCHKGWPTAAYLAQHKYYHKMAPNFRCATCPASFKSSQGLTIHERVHTNSKPYTCQFCGKKFTQRSHVKQHEAVTHIKKKKERCNICDRTFSYNYALQAHLRAHRGYRPFVCPYCFKAFTDTVGRHKHVKAHHPDKIDDFIAYKKEHQVQEIRQTSYIPNRPPSEAGDTENVPNIPKRLKTETGVKKKVSHVLNYSISTGRRRNVKLEAENVEDEDADNEDIEEYEIENGDTENEDFENDEAESHPLDKDDVKNEDMYEEYLEVDEDNAEIGEDDEASLYEIQYSPGEELEEVEDEVALFESGSE